MEAQNDLTPAEQILSLINSSQKENYENLVKIIHARVTDMIVKDFTGLIHLLYRCDIDENKLKEHIAADKSGDTALVITKLLIARELEKKKSRDIYKPDFKDL